MQQMAHEPVVDRRRRARAHAFGEAAKAAAIGIVDARAGQRHLAGPAGPEATLGIEHLQPLDHPIDDLLGDPAIGGELAAAERQQARGALEDLLLARGLGGRSPLPPAPPAAAGRRRRR